MSLKEALVLLIICTLVVGGSYKLNQGGEEHARHRNSAAPAADVKYGTDFPSQEKFGVKSSLFEGGDSAVNEILLNATEDFEVTLPQDNGENAIYISGCWTDHAPIVSKTSNGWEIRRNNHGEKNHC